VTIPLWVKGSERIGEDKKGHNHCEQERENLRKWELNVLELSQ
jgi:hypothetical protein